MKYLLLMAAFQIPSVCISQSAAIRGPAVSSCSKFAQLIGESLNIQGAVINEGRLPRTGKRTLTVSEGEKLFFLDPATLRIKGYVNGEAERMARRTGSRAVSTLPKPSRQRAQNLLHVLTGNTKLGFWKETKLDQYGSKSTSYAFSEIAFGYATNGVGNMAEISFGADGRITAFTQVYGWTYQRPDVRVSKASAFATANRLAKMFKLGDVLNGSQIKTLYVIPNAELGSKARGADKVARLAHLVPCKNGSVYVEVATGSVIGGTARHRRR